VLNEIFYEYFWKPVLKVTSEDNASLKFVSLEQHFKKLNQKYLQQKRNVCKPRDQWKIVI
jgi:hypothetical protein